jgi:membrane protease YdiL (CAAX protease family)
MDTDKKELMAFLGLLFGLTAISYVPICLLHIPHAENSLYALGFVFSPCVAAISTRLIYQGNLRDLGWRWGRTKYAAISYFLPVAYGVAVCGLVCLLRLGALNHEYVSQFILVKRAWLDFLVFATFGVLVRGIAAFGEEIGFRGFLVPQLAKMTSFTKMCLISGSIWALWHFPIVMLTDYGRKDALSLFCMTISLISASFIFAWLRLRSGSVWTAVIFHASHNHYIQDLFDNLVSDTGYTKRIVGEFGIGLAVVLPLVAFICCRWSPREFRTEASCQDEY